MAPNHGIKIAVAIPAYNRKELLASLLSTIPYSWQVFVSDNDSSLLPLAHPFPKNVIASHCSELIGQYANWNRALAMVYSNCTHVLIPSDDDLFLPEAGDIVEKAVQKHQESDIFIFGCDLTDESNNRRPGFKPSRYQVYDKGGGFAEFIYGVDARMPGVLFSLSFLRRIGLFDERFKVTAGDSELIQRSLLLGKSVFIPETIGLYRVWAGAITQSMQASEAWLSEVALWTSKIAALLISTGQSKRLGIKTTRYQDEVYARNMLAGLNSLCQRKEYSKARLFYLEHPIPRYAFYRTRARIASRRVMCDCMRLIGVLWRRLADQNVTH